MSDPRSKVGDQDLKGGIDGDKLAKEARELELRQKIEKLQRLKSRGLSYDGAGATSSKLAPASTSGSKLERVSETLLEEQMREAEAMFGGPVVTNPQEAAAERAKAADEGRFYDLTSDFVWRPPLHKRIKMEPSA